MYEELVRLLKDKAERFDYDGWVDTAVVMEKAADAIEELSRQRDRAYARLCEWCGVCPEGKRNAEDCEIAALNPEPQKEEA